MYGREVSYAPINPLFVALNGHYVVYFSDIDLKGDTCFA